MHVQFFSRAHQALTSNAVTKTINWQAFPKRVSLPHYRQQEVLAA